ncbi:MAG: acyl-CoA dehydratase activase [Pseudobutyrivibrio sp.]|nr:acyl-CoA dehydratase activase [Pseudobutyrivibrio sp.]
MKQIGIDIGASTVKLAVLDGETIVRKHYGKISEAIIEALKESGVDRAAVAITGQQAKGLTRELAYYEEIPCLIDGLKAAGITQGSVIEIGAQSSKFVTGLDRKAPDFAGNEHCAGGTGSFFEDQMSRLGLNIEDYSKLVQTATSIPRLSGRCSVFAKTDIIHRQQEGVQIPDILKGLCYAMVRNFKATIVKNADVAKPVYLCGGVSKNAGVVEAVKELFALEDDELIIHKDALVFGAMGAALRATEEVDISELMSAIKELNVNIYEHSLGRLPESEDNYVTDPEREPMPAGVKPYLGIDIGSTSTDLVLVGPEGQLYDYLYLRTKGDPEAAVRSGLKTFGKSYEGLEFAAVGVTGSGRERIGRLIGADCIKDEITAQAKCATYIADDVDTVFEIGGQDSKYISIRDGAVVDFQMNKICAAGTGSFVEEQAARLGIPLDKYGDMALSAEHPIDLGERCTVFIETSISSAMSDGAKKEDIAAGLCHSIIKNYLHKVVMNKAVGSKILLQGGVCYNPGIVAAFKDNYGDRVQVSPYFSISGAVGAALLAKEERVEGPSTFHGFIEEDHTGAEVLSEEVKKNIQFFNRPKEIFFSGYDGTIDPNKKTVGVPYVLMLHKFFPMANAYFKSLGFNVVISDATNEEIILKSQEKAQGETCYPVKLIYGHFQQLVERGVDYIFMPKVHTLKHTSSQLDHNYACAYMQAAPEMVAKALDLESKGITLLSPVFDLDFGKQAMVSSMIGLGKIINRPKPLCIKALMSGAQMIRRYDTAIEAQGKALLDGIKPDDKVLVIITRNYGINDDVLNMRIPEILLKKGYKVITLSHLPAHDLDVSADHPNLYWPFGQHIISGAKMIAKHPNLYAVYLTNHGCGPDTMISHLFKQEMGDKPYLQIEVDEHFSKVGVITRIEAFLNSLNSVKSYADPSHDIKDVDTVYTNIVSSPFTDEELFVPDYGVYSEMLKLYLEENHNGVRLLKIPDVEEMEIGRSVTETKEYLPFTAYAEQVLGHDAKGTYIIPSTKGAEADGQYPYAISAVLKAKGIQGKHIYAPVIEDIPKIVKDADGLFRAIVAGDFIKNGLIKEEFNSIPTWEELEQVARGSKDAWDDKGVIGVLGEPMVVARLADPRLEEIKKEFRVLQAGMAEYLLFLWVKNHGNTYGIGQMKAHLDRIRNILGEGIYSDIEALQEAASAGGLGVFDAGNGSYRFAKAILMGNICDGVIQMAPRYENISMIMENYKLKDRCQAPYYLLAIDGDFDEASARKLGSFLYYCK